MCYLYNFIYYYNHRGYLPKFLKYDYKRFEAKCCMELFL